VLQCVAVIEIRRLLAHQKHLERLQLYPIVLQYVL